MATLDRDKALDMALAQIDKQFGKGSVMRLGVAMVFTLGKSRCSVCSSGSVADARAEV